MLEPRHSHELPAGTQSFGMGLFLTTLSILFAAGLLLYWILRLRHGESPGGLPLHSMGMPHLLFFSTPCMLLASACIHRALGRIRRGQMEKFKFALALGVLFSVVFVCLQVPALWELGKEHHHASAALGAASNHEAMDLATRPQAGAPRSHAFYGSVLFLIAIHAAHVLGGLIPLGVVVANTWRGRYSPQRHGAVQMLVWYWHFLDIVWLVLFGTFLVLG